MNYLAHFHLSYGNDDLLTGALLGDFVKGPLTGQRSTTLEQGILLHRKIDAFTDGHSALRETHRLFDKPYRRYAGIMTDVVFDHFLNRHWQRFHPQPLEQFSEEIYQHLLNNPHLGPQAQQQADNLARHKVLENYRHWQTVSVALEKIGQRIRGNNPLHSAGDEMQRFYVDLEQQFLLFYPQLQQHVAAIRQSFKQR